MLTIVDHVPSAADWPRELLRTDACTPPPPPPPPPHTNPPRHTPPCLASQAHECCPLGFNASLCIAETPGGTERRLAELRAMGDRAVGARARELRHALAIEMSDVLRAVAAQVTTPPLTAACSAAFVAETAPPFLAVLQSREVFATFEVTMMAVGLAILVLALAGTVSAVVALGCLAALPPMARASIVSVQQRGSFSDVLCRSPRFYGAHPFVRFRGCCDRCYVLFAGPAALAELRGGALAPTSRRARLAGGAADTVSAPRAVAPLRNPCPPSPLPSLPLPPVPLSPPCPSLAPVSILAGRCGHCERVDSSDLKSASQPSNRQVAGDGRRAFARRLRPGDVLLARDHRGSCLHRRLESWPAQRRDRQLAATWCA